MQVSPLELQQINKIIDDALLEDLGQNGDITSNLVIAKESKTKFKIVARQEMVVAGVDIAKLVFRKLSSDICLESGCKEGDLVNKNTTILYGEGNSKAIFAAERVALNLLKITCGVATITNQMVKKISSTQAKILDTRKTIPCLRPLQRYAVRVGGGQNHRYNLESAILIKDNHIAVCGSIAKALKLVSTAKEKVQFIEIECDNIEQVKEALSMNVADVILLDNMSISDLKKAVSLRDGRVKFEASGNVNLSTVFDIANTGVDYISVGSITHSPPNLDLGLDV